MNFSTNKSTFPTKRLREWFFLNQRDLPWRRDPTPYRVWISEIMLQQTQAQVVILYFEKWMEKFPTIHALANAPLESILKAWEGLGYYSRARNIKQAALQIVEEYQGKFPDDEKKLSRIKGIGPYTKGAILSFAFHRKAAAVDGNVLRVLSRFFALSEPVDTLAFQRKMGEIVLSLLPDEAPWVIMEALIELGALICKKKPVCASCPLKENCMAFSEGVTEKLPLKKKRPQPIFLKRMVAVILYRDKFLLKKGERGKVMQDLYEFPYLDIESESTLCAPLHAFEAHLNTPLALHSAMPREVQTYTKYKVELFPFVFFTQYEHSEFLWKNFVEAKALPFSSGHKRILEKAIEGLEELKDD